MIEKQVKGRQQRREDSCLLYGWGQNFNGWKELGQGVIAAAAGENHYVYLTAKHECYGVGSNRFGQLGLENQPSATVPTELFSYPPLRNDVALLACGAQHTLLLTTKGEVYACGLNLKGQLGLCSCENVLKPRLVAGLLPHGEKNIKASNRELVRRPRPAIYGILEKFDLNVKTEGDEEYGAVPLLLGPDQSIEDICCGALHTLALSNKGRVFAAGMYNTKGTDDYSSRAQFQQVKLAGEGKSEKSQSRKATAICCGLSTCVVLAEGVPYVWGKLGKLTYNLPTAVQFRADMSSGYHIFDVKAGDAFLMFLSSKGEVFTMGENLHGQLGHSELFCDSPTKVQRLPLIRSIYAGRNYCLAVSVEDGMVYGWGANQHGQLGLSNQQNMIIQTPTPIGIKLKEGDRLVLGSFQTFLLKRDRLQEVKVEQVSQQASDAKEETISLKQYKKLQYEYQILKSLNLSLIEKTQRPPMTDQQSQTPSKFEVSGISKYRTFNSNLEIDWKQLKIESNISEGGYGVIYKAKWRETLVAVKKFKIETGDVGVRDFLSECHAMEAVRHPNIVMFLGACTKPPNYAIIMEYCQKGSLWSLLQNPSIELKWDQRRRIALEIARAVHYLHMFNPPILHRDLKSLNILLDDNLHVRIADFGWTKTLDNYMTNKIGTYQWMAPEVIGEPKYSEKADVFSYSIILWEIASREPPYKNINGQQVSQEVYNDDLRPTIPKKTPEAFTRLTTRCWEREPNKRPTFKQIIYELETMKLPAV